MANSGENPQKTPDTLPDVDLPVSAQAGNSHEISKKSAVLTTAGAILLSGAATEAAQATPTPTHEAARVAHIQEAAAIPISDGDIIKTGQVSAAKLLRLRSGGTKPSSAEVSNQSTPEQYTQGYFEGMRNGTIKFGYFNGTVVVDNEVKIYTCIDPDFHTSGKNSCLSQYPWWYKQELAKYPHNPTLLLSDPRNKFGGGQRPAMLIDKKNQVWLSFSIESGGYRASEGTGFSGNSEKPPVDQLDFTFFIPLKGNAGHIKFYSSAPKGQPPFIAGGIQTYDPITATHLLAGNFICTTPGLEAYYKSDYLGSWTTNVKDPIYPKNKDFINGDRDKPAFESTKYLSSFIENYATGKPYPQYRLPSVSKIRQLIARAQPN